MSQVGCRRLLLLLGLLHRELLLLPAAAELLLGLLPGKLLTIAKLRAKLLKLSGEVQAVAVNLLLLGGKLLRLLYRELLLLCRELLLLCRELLLRCWELLLLLRHRLPAPGIKSRPSGVAMFAPVDGGWRTGEETFLLDR